MSLTKKGKRKVQGVPQSQAAAHPRHEEEANIDRTKGVQIEETSQSEVTEMLKELKNTITK